MEPCKAWVIRRQKKGARDSSLSRLDLFILTSSSELSPWRHVLARQ